MGSNYAGFVKITANRPIAVTAAQTRDDAYHVAMGYNAYSSGHSVNHLASVNNIYNDWKSGAYPGNLGSTGSVTLTYYDNLGGTSNHTASVSGNSWGNFYLPGLGFPNNTYGPATLVSGNNQPLVSTANTTKYNSDIAVGQNGFLGSDGTASISFPLVIRNSGGWITGVQVHNVGTQNTTVKLKYYNANGTFRCEDPSSGTITLTPGRGYNFYQPSGCLPNGFVGSAVAIASGGDHRIVGQATVTNYGQSRAFSYSGLNR